MPGDRLAPIAEVYGQPPPILWAGMNDLPIPGAYPYEPTQRVPIIGRVPAGEPMLAEQYIEGYTYIDIKEPGDYFALRVTGDSMNAAKINDGDLVIVKKQCTVENGQIAVVIVNGFDGTVKKYYQSGSTVTLMPVSFNPEHQPKMVDAREVTIVGRVVQSQIFF